MDYAAYVEYFRTIATRNKLIAHTPEAPRFFAGNPEEWAAASNKKVKATDNIMLMGPIEAISDIEPTIHNPTRIFQANLLLLRHVGISHTDFVAEENIKNELFLIGEQIKAYIRNDFAKYNKTSHNIIKSFNSADVDYKMIDKKMLAGFTGWLVQIKFGTKSNFYNENDWLP